MDVTSYLLGKKAGGSGGTTDYSQLTNKPSINSVELDGNKTSSDLELQDVMQFSTMPTASASNLGKIVQYTGTTGNTYTNGYFYECVSDGENTPTYSWEQVNVQDGVSYTAGTNISIDNGVISDTIPFDGSGLRRLKLGESASIASGYYDIVAIGASSSCSNSWTTAVGSQAKASKNYSTALGCQTKADHASAVAIGYKAGTTKNNQCVIGSSYGQINEAGIYTSSGYKVLATENYVDTAINNAITTTLGGSY